MDNLDRQLFYYSGRLKEEVGVETKYLVSICTTIYNELKQLSIEDLREIETASPVGLELRIEELTAFNMMMDRVNKHLSQYPEIVRSQVIVQNYVAFVYLKDNCFDVTKKVMPSGTLTRRICQFLLNNPVRAFRNAIAHGNWQYTNDYSGIKYYAHKGESKPNVETLGMSEFTVGNSELEFWQALSRATAYTIYSYIIEIEKDCKI
ncbi:MAG: hypothetical protein M0Q53_02620 [Prolixibacteraceae bacterium]|jgi:hypothetical protein|nr:hypothetical protein [Prolixibacteraceae bacterium]